METLIKKASAFSAKCFKFVKENRITVKIVSIALIFFLIVVVDTVSVGLSFGFDVKYQGKVIATVQNRSVSEDARDIAVHNVNSEGASGAIEVPKLTLTLTVADNFDTAKKVADAMIDNTDEVIEASVLAINGEEVAITDSLDLSALLEERKTSFNIEGAENSAEFSDDVKIEKGLYLKEDLHSEDYIREIIGGLEVKTTSKITTDTIIRYKTQTVYTAEETIGYSKITTVGKNGISRSVELIEQVNGEEISNEVLDTEIVSEAVDEVITMGTSISKENIASTSSAGFICPLAKGSYKISAYWGDGRGHKAIDLAADKGTAIFAAASGTVLEAGYDRGYGYYVLISHGNGIKTKYAHACALYVKAGETVTQGQMIAAVGCTGYSTGNHLHFEVIVNGTRVNPAPYINLR